MILRLLQPADDRSSFSCGDPAYDNFLLRYAAQNQFKHRISTTIVAVEDERVMGYATFAVGEVAIDDLPDSARGALPRYPVPVLRLGRLAVDTRYQGHGLGTLLVGHVLQTALRLRDTLGCAAVVVDALPERADFYRALGFVPLRMVRGRSRSVGTVPMVLALRMLDGPAASGENGRP